MPTQSFVDFHTHTVSFSQNPQISLIQIGKNIITPGLSYPQYHSNYLIGIVKSGKGVFETHGKKFNLSQNDAFICRPNELSVQTADKNDSWEICFFSFNGSLSDDIIKKTIFGKDVVSIPLKDSSLSSDIINATYFLNSNLYSEFTTLEYLFKFLSYFDIYKSVHNINQGQSQNKYVSAIKKYIHANYQKNIKIADIAEELSINRSHLYRIFHKEIGIGVEEYIITLRINHAKQLLIDSSLPVTTIAQLVGYKNYPTFLKRFKKIVGITPIEYRDLQKEKTL